MYLGVYGAYTYPDGSSYTGEWNEEGQKHGMGQLLMYNGNRYDGCFDSGMFNGLGVLMLNDGSRYEGEFMQGWFHGYGVFTREDGMKFEGEFRGGRIWGLGLVTYSDGSHGKPKNEGFFQDCRFVRKEKCPKAYHRAQKVAFIAKAQNDDVE